MSDALVRRCLAVAGLIGLFALGGAAQARGQERQAVSGTSVSLVPMQGFVPAIQFAGFAHETLQASVLIVEFPPAAHPQLVELFKDLETAKTRFAQQNVRILSRDTIETTMGGVAMLVGTQENSGVVLDKWIALFKGVKTVMITVQAPQLARLDPAAVKAMLASVTLGTAPTLAERLNALPFAVKPAAPFRVVDTFGGAAVLMTVGDLDTDPGRTQPLAIVAYQVSAPVALPDLDAAAERLLRQTKDFDAAKIEKRERPSFAGSTGVLLGGTHVVGGSVKRFAQYMAVGKSGRVIRMVVSADGPVFEKLASSIDAIAQSIAFRD